MGFLTNVAPSLDPDFPGNATLITGTDHGRYVFGVHSLLPKGSNYYDATSNGIYTSRDAFITANINGPATDDADGEFFPTPEGWNLYRHDDTVYDSWGGWDYKSPGSSPGLHELEIPPLSSESGIEFTGNVDFDLVDDDLNGLAEALTAEVEVRLHGSGRYMIFGTLEKGGQLVANGPAWESALFVTGTIDGISGTHSVTLRFSGEQVFRSQLDGPYELVLHTIGTGDSPSAKLPTPILQHTQFGELPARLLGISDAAMDTDDDGKYEFLEATVDLEVRVESELHLQGGLSKEGQSIADHGVSQFLAPGARQVALQFDGAKIRRSGLDGPYRVSVTLDDASSATIDGLYSTTEFYDASSFAAVLQPYESLDDQGIDTNGNGLFDLLRVEFEVEVERPGSYLLIGVLRGAGSPLAVYADTSVTLAAGPASLQIEFQGPLIHAQGLDGPYTIDILVRNPETSEQLDALTLPQSTSAYTASQFDALP